LSPWTTYRAAGAPRSSFCLPIDADEFLEIVTMPARDASAHLIDFLSLSDRAATRYGDKNRSSRACRAVYTAPRSLGATDGR
jgi:hypothetical protein